MSDRVWGVLLVATSLAIAACWMGRTLGWDIIPQVIGVVAMVLGLAFLMFLGVILIGPPRK
jgi:hypothetical protein